MAARHRPPLSVNHSLRAQHPASSLRHQACSPGRRGHSNVTRGVAYRKKTSHTRAIRTTVPRPMYIGFLLFQFLTLLPQVSAAGAACRDVVLFSLLNVT